MSDNLAGNLLRNEAEIRPNSNFGPASSFRLTLNGDTSDYNALQVQYRRPLSRSVQALLNYTWSHCIDTNSIDAFPVIPGAVLPAQDDRGSCDFDVRHNFTGAVTYSLPHFTRQRFVAQIVNNWLLDAIVQARNGFPINVTYTDPGFPGVNGSVVLRPDLIPGSPVWLSNSSAPGGKVLNFNAFDSITPMNENRQGTLGRNTIAGFGATEADLSILRKFPFSERVSLQFRADIFNIFNHPNFAPPESSLDTGSLFGSATQMLNQGLGGLTPLYQIGGPRSVQLSLRLAF